MCWGYRSSNDMWNMANTVEHCDMLHDCQEKLRAREQRVAEREADLVAREKRVADREADLAKMFDRLTEREGQQRQERRELHGVKCCPGSWRRHPG